MGCSIDNLGFVVKDYQSILNCFGNTKSKFSLAMNASGNLFCGSINNNKFEKGLLFDNKMNYFTFSNSFEYRGYIKNVDEEVMYIGSLRDKQPYGYGIIAQGSKIVFFGQFNNGVPSGKGFYFNKKEELNFSGLFNSLPLYGIFCKNQRYYEGIFNTVFQEKREVDFETNSLTISSLKESKKMHLLFEDFIIKGSCKHYDERIYEITGNIQFGVTDHTGEYQVVYYNGCKYFGKLESSSRIGFGLLTSQGEKLRIIGLFKEGNEVRGYLLIDHNSENSKSGESETLSTLVIPKVVYGTIIYDSQGRVAFRGKVKATMRDGSVYYGQFINNGITGYGKLYRNDDQKSIYTGQFYFGQQFGIGELVTKNFVYKGEFQKNQFHGFGQYTDSSVILKGYWQNNLCFYGAISFKNRKSLLNAQGVAFNFMYILFDSPRDSFDLNNIRGHIELFFDQKTNQRLTEFYKKLNGSESTAGGLKDFKVEERRGSLTPRQRAKAESIVNLLRTKSKAFEEPIFTRQSQSIPKKRLLLKQSSFIKNDSIMKASFSTSKIQGPVFNFAEEREKSKAKKSVNNAIALGLSMKVASNLNTSVMSMTMGDIGGQFDKIFSLSGCIYQENGKCMLLGVIRRYDESFCIINSDPSFVRGVFLGWNSNKTEEIMGEMQNFNMEGIGISHWKSSKIMGEFTNSQPNGLIVNYRQGKEDYIGDYEHGKKHGWGIRNQQSPHLNPSTFLYNFRRSDMQLLVKLDHQISTEPNQDSKP